MTDLKQFQFTAEEATEEGDETYAKAKFLEVRHLKYLKYALLISLLISSGLSQGEGLGWNPPPPPTF